jgi:hypothetical protein
MELLFPTVQARLRKELGSGGNALVVRPWLVHVPGVLHAQHGQQHHDINRFPWLESTSPVLDAAGRLAVPTGSYVDALTHLRRRGRQEDAVVTVAIQAVRMGVGLAGALRSLSRAERSRVTRERSLASAPPAGLSPAAVVGLDRVAAATPTSITRRALTMVAARLPWSRSGPAVPYMQAAAETVHQVLAGQDLAVPFYVFGHTHVVTDVAIAGGAARYLNPGTWSSTTRRVPGGERRCGVVVIETASGAAPRARVECPG